MNTSKIVLLKLNENKDEYSRRHQLTTANLRSEVHKKIGSEFDKSNGLTSRDLIRGLSPEQEVVYLPKLIGVSASHPEFAERAKDYWSDFSIIPTADGIKLNIATNSYTADDGQTIEVPVNLDDYMIYKFAMASSRVAKGEDLNNLSFFDFYLEDLSEMKAKEETIFISKKKAITSFARLASKFEENIDKINWILEITKEKNTTFDESMPQIEKEMLLDKLSTERPVLFNSLMDDKDLETKALLNKAVTYLVITKEGNDYFYLNENIGSEDKGAISWFTKPEKSAQVASIKSKIEQLVSSTKK